MVFVGAGVLDFVDGAAEADFNVTDREAATLARFGFAVGDQPEALPPLPDDAYGDDAINLDKPDMGDLDGPKPDEDEDEDA